MAQATGARMPERQPSELVSYSGASGYVYYKGTFVVSTDTDVITPGNEGLSTFLGYKFLGVAETQIDLTGGQTGLSAVNQGLKVWKTGEFTMEANGVGVSADIGQRALLFDDQTVGTSKAGATLDVGEIIGLPTTSSYRVRITNAIGNVGA